jgi:putative tryptophan/tyrosine transport system substrate-binding protein
MRRRQFIAGLGSAAAAWPRSAWAQRLTPVIGYLGAGGPESERVVAIPPFAQGLGEIGYVEGQNVTIEYRFAEGQYTRLPELAADLVRQRVSVIVATPNLNSARVAEAATATIPILFMVSDDPAKLGLVASLNRPGGNATGVNYFISELAAKRVQLLRHLIPTASRFGVLINPAASSTDFVKRETIAAASKVGVQPEFVEASDPREIDAAFTTFDGKRIDALLVLPDTLFANQRAQIAALAARHAIPALYTVREYVDAGGLISYGTSLKESYHQLGVYAGRILKGANPADLPVVQSTKIELVINLKTANALGISVPSTLLAVAEEVIE